MKTPPPGRRVRAADVAKLAGVSTATVSYVLNNTPNQKISPETQQRVREAAKELGYITNYAAQTLARGRSSFAIVDLNEMVTYESAQIASVPILAVLRELGYEPFLTWWANVEDPNHRVEQLLRFARATRPDAVVTLLPLPTEVKESLTGVGVSFISSMVADPAEMIPALSAPVVKQVSYLASKGHREIFYAAKSAETLSILTQIRNRTGAETAESLGIAWTPLPEYTDSEHLAEILDRAMVDHPEATAVAAYNDTDALATISALHSLGVTMPQRMAVIGIDNEDFGAFTYPTLTTVTYNFELTEIESEHFASALERSAPIGLLRDLENISRPEVIVRGSA